MPAWMSLLHAAVQDPTVPPYVRLFLLKAVLHVDKRHVARQEAEAAAIGEIQVKHFLENSLTKAISTLHVRKMFENNLYCF